MLCNLNGKDMQEYMLDAIGCSSPLCRRGCILEQILEYSGTRHQVVNGFLREAEDAEEVTIVLQTHASFGSSWLIEAMFQIFGLRRRINCVLGGVKDPARWLQALL